MKKVELCWELLDEGVEFVTEAEFKQEHGNIRADIFVLDDGRIYEIESRERNLDERKKRYPDNTEIIPLWDE